MKVRELMRQDIDIDVYDKVTDELGIAFCGAMELTEEGEKEWGDVLEYDFTLENGFGGIIAMIDVDGDDWEERVSRAKAFFYSLAGYCSSDDYDKWFVCES